VSIVVADLSGREAVAAVASRLPWIVRVVGFRASIYAAGLRMAGASLLKVEATTESMLVGIPAERFMELIRRVANQRVVMERDEISLSEPVALPVFVSH
jgi:hypothetical protein